MSGAEAELSVGGARRQIADWVSVWRRRALTPVTKLEIIIGGLAVIRQATVSVCVGELRLAR